MTEEKIDKKIDDHSKRIRVVEEAIIHMTRIADMANEHDEILKGKGDQRGFMERVRDLEAMKDGIGYWVRMLALAFIGQFAAVLVSVFIFLLKILPAFVTLVNDATRKP